MPTQQDKLQQSIEHWFALGSDAIGNSDALKAFRELRDALETGVLRSAEPDASQSTGWRVNAWVKRGILLGFRLGHLESVGNDPVLSCVDKSTFPTRRFTPGQNIRIVTGGSAVRAGAYLASGVVVVPPAYVNTGSYVDEGALVDSHALVGSCAQIGKRVHISGGVGIGVVLEPLQAEPVIVEDDCFIGARSEVAEGVIVRKGAVLSMGVFLGASTKIVDRETGEIFIGEVPEYAVVVPGALPGKPMKNGEIGPSTACAVIVKRVDERTRAKTSINELLRD